MKKLKAFIISFLCVIGLTSFCNAGAPLSFTVLDGFGTPLSSGSYSNTIYSAGTSAFGFSKKYSFPVFSSNLGFTGYDICISTFSSNSSFTGSVYFCDIVGGNPYVSSDTCSYFMDFNSTFGCYSVKNNSAYISLSVLSDQSYNSIFLGYHYSIFPYGSTSSSSCPECEQCEQCQQCETCTPLNSETCSPYFPIIDQSYCVSNNLCPTIDCPEGGSGASEVFINDIDFSGFPKYYFDIPGEIEFDYNQINDDLHVDILGYNVDTGYIQAIVNVQSYKPSTQDFTKLVQLITPYFGIIFVVILVLFIRSLIRKVFK